MIIKQASDLHFTYVKNTPELREVFINKCDELGIGVCGIGSEKYLEVYSNGCDEFEICGTDDLEAQSKELTMSDLTGIPTQTPEEKEVLDGIDSAGEIEWKNGDSVKYHNKHEGEGGLLTFVGIHPTHKDHAVLYGKHLNCGYMSAPLSMLSKPETPQHREERERLEAAEDLYYAYMSHWDFKPDWEVLDETNRNAFLTIVDKTKYRKEKAHGAN